MNQHCCHRESRNGNNFRKSIILSCRHSARIPLRVKRQRTKTEFLFPARVVDSRRCDREQRLLRVVRAVRNIFSPGLFAQCNAGKEELIYCEAALMRQAHRPLCPLFHTARCTCSAVCRPLDPPVTVMASVIWK